MSNAHIEQGCIVCLPMQQTKKYSVEKSFDGCVFKTNTPTIFKESNICLFEHYRYTLNKLNVANWWHKSEAIPLAKFLFLLSLYAT